ncbi:Hypothetical protein SRAE_2000340900 [Strongyloides ratti]|uniref:Uncharacterized protein n=1 Tax=Strongyloides ratti TaxID=34506 RepID=A0A090MZD7_STRRB|nr:Hypothetical protein SRAE_2000340900 [Strongyloides ratti]CEF68754.1 Hypothetical protein SRAE_2000340900 [Strongyloides ratti]
MKYFFINLLLLTQSIFCFKKEEPQFIKPTSQFFRITGFINDIHNYSSYFSIEINAKIRNIFSIESTHVHLARFNIYDLEIDKKSGFFYKKITKKIKLIKTQEEEEEEYIKLTDAYEPEKNFLDVLSKRAGPYLIENIVFHLKNMPKKNEIIINIKSRFFIPPFLFQINKEKKMKIDDFDSAFEEKLSILCIINADDSKKFRDYTCITYITNLKNTSFSDKGYVCRCSDAINSNYSIFEKMDSNHDKLLNEEKNKFRNIFEVSNIDNNFEQPYFLHATNEIFYLESNNKKNVDLKLMLSNKHKKILLFLVNKNFSENLLCSVDINQNISTHPSNCVLKRNPNNYIHIMIDITKLKRNFIIKVVYLNIYDQYFQIYKTFITRIFKQLREPRSLQFFPEDCHYIPNFLKQNYDQHLRSINNSLSIEINGKHVINVYVNSNFENATNDIFNTPSYLANYLCGDINKTGKIDFSKIINAKVLYKTLEKEKKMENESEEMTFKSFLLFEFSNISKVKFNYINNSMRNDYSLYTEKSNNGHLWKKFLNIKEDNYNQEFTELETDVGVWIWIWSILALWMLLCFFSLPVKHIFLTKYIYKIFKDKNK